MLAAAGVERILVSDPGPASPRSTPPSVNQVEQAVALECPIVVLAGPAPHAELARWVLQRGRHCVSASDDAADVTRLLALESLAVRNEAILVVGAAMMPGLSGLLARSMIDAMDTADEVHCFAHGTGGPECARQHHRALAGTAVAWHDGEWIERPAGSGRELCWFPDPVGPRDCYRVESPEPALLVGAFPGLRRASARFSATRRDRLTSRLPMLSPPHADGGVGGVRVEVRGAIDGQRVTQVLGAAGRPARLAGAVAGAYAEVMLAGTVDAVGVTIPGASRRTSAAVLSRVRDAGISVAEFVGPSS